MENIEKHISQLKSIITENAEKLSSNDYNSALDSINKLIEFIESDEIVIMSLDRYNYLIELSNYVDNWCKQPITCKHCGTLNPEGYLCINCGKSNR